MLATKHTNIPKYVYPGEFLVCDSRLSSFLSAQKENLRQRGRRNEKKRTKRRRRERGTHASCRSGCQDYPQLRPLKSYNLPGAVGREGELGGERRRGAARTSRNIFPPFYTYPRELFNLVTIAIGDVVRRRSSVTCKPREKRQTGMTIADRRRIPGTGDTKRDFPLA